MIAGVPPEITAHTIVLDYNDPAMLEKLKVGDRIRFTADKIGGQYTVMAHEPAH